MGWDQGGNVELITDAKDSAICPVCGTACKIVREGGNHYEPLWVEAVYNAHAALSSSPCPHANRVVELEKQVEMRDECLTAHAKDAERLREVIREMGHASLNALVISAQETMTAYLVPDGIDADQAIERVIELLCEIQKAAFVALSGGSQ
jgi:hypothetical protein